ncbi:MAG: hypothetical protein O7B26_06865, partial [Planctomycetota bacterium]|nr:hypothetical protein [Planctomycetota bacterium]
LISRLPYLIALIRIQVHDAAWGFELYQFGKAALCLVILLLPTTCLGFSFPLVAQIQARRSQQIGTHVGSTYAWNTTGNVLGTVATSLVLLPVLGLLGAFHFNFALNLIAGVAILLVAAEVKVGRRLAAGVAAAIVCVVYIAAGTGWLQPLRLARNHLRLNDRPDDADATHPSSSFEAWKQRFVAREDDASHFYFEEDSHTTVLVYGNYKQIVLYVNGKPDASTNRDLPTQMFLAHLPLLMVPQARTLLVIGHGSGITAGSALRHPIRSADIVEISRGVLNADSVFVEFNYHVLNDPRVRMHEDDGQSFLRTTPRRYDLIISEPSNPWIAGIGGLFTVDYFQIVKSRLTDGGAAMIWFHEYEQSKESVELVLRTILSVFPHVEVFRSHDYADIIAVASANRIEPDFAAMERRFDEPAIRNDLARVGICNLAGLLVHHTISEARLPSLIPTGPLNTAAHERLQYEAPRSFFVDKEANFLKHEDSLYQGKGVGPDTLLARYIAYRSDAEEPVTREELLDVAQTAEFLGWSSRRVGAVMRAVAKLTPSAGIDPTRPARGRVADPATMGIFEANYWDRRYTKEGRPGDAIPFARRLAELKRSESSSR